MTRQLFIDVGLFGTRAACVAQGRLTDLSLFPRHQVSKVSLIYLGRVHKIDEGLDAVFIDLGTAGDGFLKRKDIPPRIFETLHEGQKIPVQVLKDPQSGKGLQVSAYLKLQGDHLIFSPGGESLTFSKKLKNEDARQQISAALRRHIGSNSVTVRTSAVNADINLLTQELKSLASNWRTIEQAMTDDKKPRSLQSPPLPSLMAARHYAGPKTEITINDTVSYQALKETGRYPSVKLHTAAVPLFDLVDLEEQISLAREHELSLPSGGWITIEKTEALTVIDVNSGSHDPVTAGESVANRANREAAILIACQIRLRNISGIIIVDFIALQGSDASKKLHQQLEKLVRDDPVAVRIVGMTELGLMQITRQRKEAPLSTSFNAPARADHPQISFGRATQLMSDLARDKAHNKQVKLTLRFGKGFTRFLEACRSEIEAYAGINLLLREEVDFAAYEYRIDSD